MNKRYAGQVFTKEAPADFKAGQRMVHDLDVKPPTIDELRKELDVATLDSLPKGYIAGWASTPDMDHVRDVVASGAFKDAIEERGLDGPRGIKLLAQHRSDQPAGKIVKLEQRTGGLWIEAQMNLEISYVKDLYEAAKMQGGLSFSIGYRLVEGGFEFIDKGPDSYWLLTKLDLFEVSVVTFPCNDAAEMLFIKSDEGDPFESIADFEKALVVSGVAKSRNEANRVTRWVKGLFSKADTPEPPVSEDKKALEDIGKSLARLKELKKAQEENNQ